MTPLINSCGSTSTFSARSLAAKRHGFERRTQCRPSVDDVEAGDLWYFPAGLAQSLQGLGPDGASCFRQCWPRNLGAPKEVFSNIPLDNLWIFQGVDPGEPGGRYGCGSRSAERRAGGFPAVSL
jgi:hypothetical protein